MKYLLDTSAWIEYLEGSQIGEKVSKILQSSECEIVTISLIIAETISKVKRKGGDVESAYNILTSSSVLIDTDKRIAKESGILHAKEKEKNDKFSLADAIIATTAKAHNLKIVTKDTHFKYFKEAILL